MNRFLPTTTRCIAASLLILAGLFIATQPAQAYVGPGMELGTLGAAFGMLMTGISAVFYLSMLWLRRIWRRVTGWFLPSPELPADAKSAHSDS